MTVEEDYLSRLYPGETCRQRTQAEVRHNRSQADDLVAGVVQQLGRGVFAGGRESTLGYLAALVVGNVLIDYLSLPPGARSTTSRDQRQRSVSKMGIAQYFRRCGNAGPSLEHAIFYQWHHPAFDCPSSQFGSVCAAEHNGPYLIIDVQ